MVKPNLGKLDRLLRFALGLWWLGGLVWLQKPTASSEGGSWVILIVAYVAVATSMIGWCPLHAVLGIKNTNQ